MVPNLADMSEHDQRETLNCVGGPLHKQRLSVPTGLRWVAFVKDQMAPPREQGVTAIESLSGIADFSTTMDWDNATKNEAECVYVRRSFITGEAGVIHILSYQD